MVDVVHQVEIRIESSSHVFFCGATCQLLALKLVRYRTGRTS